jgi:hypothetical protein
VHDVAVALEGHQLVDLSGAELDHPAHVVAGQVDQHDVLGPLLGVLDQLGGQAGGRARRCCPGSGCRRSAGRSPVPSSSCTMRLGRTAHQGQLGLAHEVHVRARVDLAQHPVDVERIGVELEVEALGQHHLEDVAGEDVLLGRVDRLRTTSYPR